jgi:hypothetical protein
MSESFRLSCLEESTPMFYGWRIVTVSFAILFVVGR